jgi:hypothetical protein
MRAFMRVVPRGIARVEQVVWPSQAGESEGWKNKHFKFKKKIDFLQSTNFKLLRQK